MTAIIQVKELESRIKHMQKEGFSKQETEQELNLKFFTENLEKTSIKEVLSYEQTCWLALVHQSLDLVGE